MLTSSSSSEISLFEWSRKMNRPLILDGAMGSILQDRHPSLYHAGIWMNRIFEANPSSVQQLHEEYIEAGADIITTYTFRTSPYALKINDPDKHNSSDLVKHAVDLCKKAVINFSGNEETEEKKEINKLKSLKTPILIAGSNSPMVHCYNGDLSKITDEEIYANHEEHIGHLMSNGVGFILNETLGFLREILIICKICSSKNIPFIISFYCDGDLKLLSGEKLIDVIEEVKKFKPMAFSFNCIKYSSLNKIINTFDLSDYPWGCYVNCGDEDMQEKFCEHKGILEGTNVLDYNISPDQLASFVDSIRKKGLRPSFIGSCCCSNAEHTKKLKELLDKK